MSLAAPRDTHWPADMHAVISPTSSLSSTFSDISHASHSTSKTDAFFASPFSPTAPCAPLPSISHIAGAAAVPRSITADFFAGGGDGPTPPPSLPPSHRPSRNPSPARHDPAAAAAAVDEADVTPKPKARLPPLARLFPSRYNSDPAVARTRFGFRDILPAAAAFSSHGHAHGHAEPAKPTPTFVLSSDCASPSDFRSGFGGFGGGGAGAGGGEKYGDRDNEGDEFRAFVDDPEPSSSSSGSGSSYSHNSDGTYDTHDTHDTHITIPDPETPLNPGAEVAGCTLVRALGRGGFSAVWLAKQPHSYTHAHAVPHGRLVALKLAPRADALAARVFAREAAILGNIAHPNIIALLDSSFSATSSSSSPEESAGGYTSLTLAYHAHGDLLDLVNAGAQAQVGEDVVRRMGRELVRAVGWLHSVGVGHRDVKLENILLSQSPSGPLDPHAPLVTLTDFGLARAIAPGELLSTRCGSEAYAAPELVLPPSPPAAVTIVRAATSASSSHAHAPTHMHSRSRSEGGHGPGPAAHLKVPVPAAKEHKPSARAGGWYDARQTDAWAVGCVLFALLTRALPFGEGPAASGPVHSTRGYREREARRAWLGRIAEGAWAWPHTEGKEGPSEGARRVVGALLTRERGRRGTMAGIAGDAWLADADGAPMQGGEVTGEFGPAAWAEVE